MHAWHSHCGDPNAFPVLCIESLFSAPGFYLQACVLSPVPLFATLWTLAHQVPLSTEVSRQGPWSGLPFPSPGDLPDPGINTASPASLHWWLDSLPLSHLGSSSPCRQGEFLMKPPCTAAVLSKMVQHKFQTTITLFKLILCFLRLSEILIIFISQNFPFEFTEWGIYSHTHKKKAKA